MATGSHESAIKSMRIAWCGAIKSSQWPRPRGQKLQPLPWPWPHVLTASLTSRAWRNSTVAPYMEPRNCPCYIVRLWNDLNGAGWSLNKLLTHLPSRPVLERIVERWKFQLTGPDGTSRLPWEWASVVEPGTTVDSIWHVLSRYDGPVLRSR